MELTQECLRYQVLLGSEFCGELGVSTPCIGHKCEIVHLSDKGLG
jgi:hypothetical protein